MPVYNEAAHLARAIERVCERGKPQQIIVVDDGSTDETVAVVQSSPYRSRLELVRHERNRGKGAAIRTAIPRVRCQAVIIQDGDLEYDPADYDRLIDAMLRTESPVVYGSRYLFRTNPYSSLGFYLGGRALSLWTNLLFGQQITDEPTCYKLFRTELLRQIPLSSDGFEFCAEVTGFVGRLGIPIPEIPISYQPRSRAEGKKITPRDGWIAFRTLWRQRTQPLEQLLAPSENRRADGGKSPVRA